MKDGKLFDKTIKPDQETEIDTQIAAMLNWKIKMAWATNATLALELVKEHVGYSLFSEKWGGHTCELFEWGGSDGSDPVNVHSAHAPTPALAICGAVLAFHEFEKKRLYDRVCNEYWRGDLDEESAANEMGLDIISARRIFQEYERE